MDCIRIIACSFVLIDYCTGVNCSNGEKAAYRVLESPTLNPWKSSNAVKRYRRSENFTSLLSSDPGNRAFVVNNTDTVTAGNTSPTTSTSTISPSTSSTSTSSSTTSLSIPTSLFNITSPINKLFTLTPRFGKKPAKLLLLKRKFLKDDAHKRRIKPKRTGISETKIKNTMRTKVDKKISSGEI